MTVHDIAVIRGDGIGPELIDAALTVLDPVSEAYGFDLALTEIDAGADTYRRTGTALSDKDLQTIKTLPATLKGPVGLPDIRHPDGTEAGLLGGVLRMGLDLYANIRPIRLLPGITSRLRAEPGTIDYIIVRENTEGMYAARGNGVVTASAVADTLLVTRTGCERIARHAFELARTRTRLHPDRTPRVTCVDKANVLRSMHYFRQIFLDVAADHPDVQAECLYVDAAAQALVMTPEHFDVIVTENLFGDILSDLGGATIGGIAMCPSANIGTHNAYFEPIHGSAPTLTGHQHANPTGQILAAAMMLDHLGETQAAHAINNAVDTALQSGTIHIDNHGRATGGPRTVATAVVHELTLAF